MPRETTPLKPLFPLVESKLRPAQPPGWTIDRPRLLRLLEAAPGGSVILVTAAPGYGKSVLLAQWAEHDPGAVAWLTVDDLDNDPAALLTYLVAALGSVGPIRADVRAALRGGSATVFTHVLPLLISSVRSWPRPAVLVVDDAHRLTDRATLDLLVAFLERLPATLRVAVAGRAVPDLPLGRLRRRRSLVEVGPSALAMDEGETELLAAAARVTLEEGEAAALVRRCEGWPAAIHLSAVLRGRADTPQVEPGAVDAAHPLDDFLRREVIAHLSDDDRTFLARTSVLEAVTPPLAEAVAEQKSAERRLRRLARDVLLIHWVAGPEPTARYHRLLRDYLARDLDRRGSGELARAHARAATALAAQGSLEPAVEHAIASGDRSAIAALVSAAALDTYYRGKAATVSRWLSALETEDYEETPSLAVVAAWIHALLGRADDSEKMADLADRSPFRGPGPDGSISFEATRSMVHAIQGRAGAAAALAEAERGLASEGPRSPWHVVAVILVGGLQLIAGRVEDARQTYHVGLSMPTTTTRANRMAALAKLASIAVRRGDWADAIGWRTLAVEELRRSNFRGVASALVVEGVAAQIDAHLGNMDRARACLVRAQLLRPLANRALSWFAVDALLEVARGYLAVHDLIGARQVLTEAAAIRRTRRDMGTLDDEMHELERALGTVAPIAAGSSALTAAELAVLPLLPSDLSSRDIAERLSVSPVTVNRRVSSICSKLWAASRQDAVSELARIGVLEPLPAVSFALRS